MSKPVFGYWDVRGIANPIRFILAYLGIEVEEKRYPITQAGVDQWKADKFNLNLEFPNLPYWKENGWHLTETRAILRYLAREKSKDLMPTKPEIVKKADMLENFLFDVWYNLIKTCLTYTDEQKEALKTGMVEKFTQLNKYIGSDQFILGDELTYLDFFLYEMIVHYHTYDPECLKSYNNLLRFKKSFESQPKIANYMKSPGYVAAPLYHPLWMAHKI